MTRLLAALMAAEAAHGALVKAKFAAAGKMVGTHAPELDNDPEIVASYERCEAARRAYDRACRKVRP